MTLPLSDDIKERAEAVAKKKGFEVQDTVWTGTDGKQWVFAVHKATQKPVWIVISRNPN